MSSDNKFSHLQKALRSRRVFKHQKTGEELPRRIPAHQLCPHPENPKIHPEKQHQYVAASMDELGQIDAIKINIRNGYIVDGHDRAWLAMGYDENMLVDVDWLDLSEDEHKLALQVFDYVGEFAIYDKDSLDSLLQAVQTDDNRLQAMLSEMAEEHELYEALAALDPDNQFGLESNGDDGLYTRKVEAPIYEPSDEKPQISDLYDNERTIQLIAEINASDLPQDEKDFLIIAAQRHTVLNFSKIADYYAHSSPDVQKLMEDSALVIIDFERAIELGFVKLTQQIADLYDKDYPNE